MCMTVLLRRRTSQGAGARAWPGPHVPGRHACVRACGERAAASKRLRSRCTSPLEPGSQTDGCNVRAPSSLWADAVGKGIAERASEKNRQSLTCERKPTQCSMSYPWCFTVTDSAAQRHERGTFEVPIFEFWDHCERERQGSLQPFLTPRTRRSANARERTSEDGAGSSSAADTAFRSSRRSDPAAPAAAGSRTPRSGLISGLVNFLSPGSSGTQGQRSHAGLGSTRTSLGTPETGRQRDDHSRESQDHGSTAGGSNIYDDDHDDGSQEKNSNGDRGRSQRRSRRRFEARSEYDTISSEESRDGASQEAHSSDDGGSDLERSDEEDSDGERNEEDGKVVAGEASGGNAEPGSPTSNLERKAAAPSRRCKCAVM